jgi:YEATS domain-containing protein 4
VRQEPFEVSESGWGEFESSIRIYFKDVDESPVDILHMIKLYYPPPALPNLKKVDVSSCFVEHVVYLLVACSPWYLKSTTK